jgi:septal ring-binding cell division protein DamX
VRVLLGNGDGTFQLSPIIYSLGGFSGTMVMADVNGDSQPDIVAPVDRGFSVLLNSGVWHAAGQGDSPLASLAAESSGTGSTLPTPPATNGENQTASSDDLANYFAPSSQAAETERLAEAQLHHSVSTEPEDAQWFEGRISATLVDDAFAVAGR